MIAQPWFGFGPVSFVTDAVVEVDYGVGSRVTVATTSSDPIKICMTPHATVARVEDGPDGKLYTVWHPQELQHGVAAAYYGPFPAGRLKPGWVW